MAALVLALGPATVPWTNAKRLSWEDYLPAIAMVESSNFIWIDSWLGPDYGRGKYMIAKITWEQFKRDNPNHWAAKMNLDHTAVYNEQVGRDVALWYLNWLERYWRNAGIGGNMVYYVLSSYNQGPGGHHRNGMATDYVQKVMAGMK